MDGSARGIGCVLMQENRPIAYTSCVLTPTQCRYAQIEKEALAVLVARKKHHYLYGAKNVIVCSDHKPLETIFNREMSKCPLRLARMFLQLKKCDLKVVWKPGKRMFVPCV